MSNQQIRVNHTLDNTVSGAINEVPAQEHLILNKFTVSGFDSILKTYGNGHESRKFVAEEGDLACLEVRFNNGDSRYFLDHCTADPEGVCFFELDLHSFYRLVSIFSRATLKRSIDKEEYELLIEEFYARGMFTIGQCSNCEFYDDCGGYEEGYINPCPLHWSIDECEDLRDSTEDALLSILANALACKDSCTNGAKTNVFPGVTVGQRCTGVNLVQVVLNGNPDDDQFKFELSCEKLREPETEPSGGLELEFSRNELKKVFNQEGLRIMTLKSHLNQICKFGGEFECVYCEFEDQCVEESFATLSSRMPANVEVSDFRAIFESTEVLDRPIPVCWKIRELVGMRLAADNE